MAAGYSTLLRNGQLDQITSKIGASGLLRLYNGTRPATGGTATTLLSEHALSATFAPAASGGVLSANAIGTDSSADNSGTATWARIVTSGGTQVIDISVSATGGGGDLQLNTVTVVAGQPVSITALTITAGNP